MIDQLVQLRHDSGAASDAYYEVMVVRLSAQRRTKRNSAECLSLALVYNEALEKLLTHLRTLKPTKSVADEIARTEQFQQLLALDISGGSSV
jgi:hypothetical protein